MTRRRTVDGDRLDALCRAHYGAQSGVVEAVLEANPGLADYVPALPAGLLVTLPDLPQPLELERLLRLWD